MNKLYCLFILFLVFTRFQEAPAQTKPGPALSMKADFRSMPVVRWRFRTDHPIISSPVIDGGIVYFGSIDSTLYALDLQSGKIKWTLKTNGEIRSSVIIDNNKVYLAGGNGVLSCIDKNDGSVAWQTIFNATAMFMAERRYDFADYYHSTPLIDDNTIYIGSGNGRMNAYACQTGALLWSFRAGDIIHNRPVISQNKLIFGSFDGYVYALDKDDGELMWKFKSVGHQYFPTGEVQGSPAIAGKTLFIGARDYNLYALNTQTGTANWNISFKRGWALSATVSDSIVYIGTSDDRVLIAADTRDGRELWRTAVKYNIFGGCSFTMGMVYVGTIWGKLFAIDKRTGKIAWEFATDGHVVHRSTYYDANENFRKEIGSILRSPVEWIEAEYKMGGIFSTPAISDDMIVITTTEGLVYGLKRS